MVHGVGDQGGRRGDVGGQGEGPLVHPGHGRHVGARRAEGHRVAESRRGHGEVEGQTARVRGGVGLVAEVVLDEHVAHAHQRHHRGQGRGVPRTLLQRGVDRLQEIGRGERAHRLLLVGDVGPVEERRVDGVDGVAPPVGGEVVPGEPVDPCTRVGGVEVVHRLQDVRRRRGRLGEPVHHRGAGPQRGGGQGDDGQHEAHQQPAQPGHPSHHRRRPRPQQDGQAQDDQRRRPVRRPQGETGGGVEHEGLEQTADPGRREVGVRAHGQHHPDQDQEHEVGADPPPHDDRGQEGHGRDQERERQQPELLRVGHRGLCPRPDLVRRPVEEPVAQAAEDLGR